MWLCGRVSAPLSPLPHGGLLCPPPSWDHMAKSGRNQQPRTEQIIGIMGDQWDRFTLVLSPVYVIFLNFHTPGVWRHAWVRPGGGAKCHVSADISTSADLWSYWDLEKCFPSEGFRPSAPQTHWVFLPVLWCVGKYAGLCPVLRPTVSELFVCVCSSPPLLP